MRHKKWMWWAAGGVILAGVTGTGMLTVHLTPLFAPVESLKGALASVFGFFLTSAAVFISVNLCRWKMWNKWPKDLFVPCDELTPTVFARPKTMELHKQKEILQKIVNHHHSDVQQYTSHLPPLQYLQLPDAWWWAVEKALDDIPVQETIGAAKSAQQEINDVYVEIEQKSQTSVAPKMLKV